MKKLLLKILFVIASVNYPKIRRDYRYFIRDNYYCRLRQIRYFFNDYVFRKKYKVIEFQGEFDQELRYVIPFAYWHYLNGTLKKTISSKNTREFYFFSPDHEEKHEQRVWQLSYTNFEVPNMTHSASFSYTKWAHVPFKERYRNDYFVYQKPILIIANKYNIEWDNPPLNYISINCLDQIIRKYGNRYQIIYNRPLPAQIVSDNSEILDLGEHRWMRENHPEVLLLNDLFEENKNNVKSFNHLQLMIYSNCTRFISVHGGTAAFASYFGGINIILSKKGIEHELKEFSTIIPKLSGARILHATTEEDILKYLIDHY
ncbi:hypothetical protein [Arcticibacter tournemirensis]|uniref:Glycosyltransferase family 61 protein n=1 Tax=Arcticibacter tournemirensis TaxID=699437 RepID=A0A4Q0MGX1_9SPHI|nr:hypothetical protein [Arcticibacter tournemirensis]RXF72216.1 hypothetical protein EKH83_00380 [Arcticibacter tournemirensis]